MVRRLGLLSELFVAALRQHNQPLALRLQAVYDGGSGVLVLPHPLEELPVLSRVELERLPQLRVVPALLGLLPHIVGMVDLPRLRLLP